MVLKCQVIRNLFKSTQCMGTTFFYVKKLQLHLAPAAQFVHFAKEVLPRFELGSRDSESRVLTATP